MAGEKILIIDDEVELSDIVGDFLKAEGFQVYTAVNGQEGLLCFKKEKHQLVILDIMLPLVDGMEICRTIRGISNVPIIMLSAKSNSTDKVISLGLGADDYIMKPFDTMELIARVKAQLRRYTQFSMPEEESGVLTFGKLVIDDKAYAVYVNSKIVNLAAKEFEILSYMAHNPNRVFTMEQIFNQIWGFEEYGDITTVRVHIRKIREKIEDNPSEPVYIKTVWGVGYKFDGECNEG
ncbi:response regulator transcription factor [Clostridium sediminicola]|uniref:response regulator transcription factor n=1 Tax=Clostridium sediminicola TaxID=3114879 RepID=UPI0031F1E5D1